MLAGYIEKIAADFVHGWAADTEEPDAVVEVAIYIDGRRIANVSCEGFRADLRDVGAYGAGRHGFHYVFPTALPQYAVERVTVRFARTGAILPNGEAELSRWQPLRPILITAPGRSGTTLLMSRLSLAPEICVADMHPFEIRQMAYWSTVVATLSGAADFEGSTHPDRLEGDGFKVGSNPFSHADYSEVFLTKALEGEYFRRYVPGQLEEFAGRMIQEYYLRIRDDRRKGGAMFFAEKNNNLDRQTRAFARELFPDLKEIVLIRDPRDLACSQLSYFRREAEVVMSQISAASQELIRIKQEDAGRVFFVRYEDLVLEHGSTMARLTDHLGIDRFRALDEERERAAFAVHATSRSPAASIGRWRSELPQQQQLWCNERWQEFMTEFGYG